MVGKPKIHAGNRLQSLRLSVFEKMKADTGWRRQDQLAEALSVSPGMITAVLSGRPSGTEPAMSRHLDVRFEAACQKIVGLGNVGRVHAVHQIELPARMSSFRAEHGI